MSRSTFPLGFSQSIYTDYAYFDLKKIIELKPCLVGPLLKSCVTATLSMAVITKSRNCIK